MVGTTNIVVFHPFVEWIGCARHQTGTQSDFHISLQPCGQREGNNVVCVFGSVTDACR